MKHIETLKPNNINVTIIEIMKLNENQYEIYGTHANYKNKSKTK